MHPSREKLILIALLSSFVWAPMPLEGRPFSTKPLPSVSVESEDLKNQGEPDIQWFREKMKIDPKYLEKNQGVLGMSWTHFLTMLFLVLFFVAAILALIMRHRRIKQLLDTLLKEEEKRGADG
jgi:hypothetical protein